MIVLALDAALEGFSAAIVRDGGRSSAVGYRGQVALERGLSAVSAVLSESGLQPHAVDRLAVGVGPGSFTGVRIAISYAKSLAQGWNLPLTGVNSFDALEAGTHTEPQRALLCVVHGRQGVISARLRSNGRDRRASGYIHDVLDGFGKDLNVSPLLLIGAAEDVIAPLGERGIQVLLLPRAIEPSALAVATVAAQRDPAPSPHEIRADYGELPAVSVPRPST